MPGGVAVTIGGGDVVTAGFGAGGASRGRVSVVGGRASDGGVLGFAGVLHLGGVLSDVRGDDGVDSRGGEVAGLLRLPASGLTYGLGSAPVRVLPRSACGLAYRLVGVAAERAVVARLKLLTKLLCPEVDGFCSGGPFTAGAGTMDRQAFSPGTSSRMCSTSSATQAGQPQYSSPTVTCRWSHV